MALDGTRWCAGTLLLGITLQGVVNPYLVRYLIRRFKEVAYD